MVTKFFAESLKQLPDFAQLWQLDPFLCYNFPFQCFFFGDVILGMILFSNSIDNLALQSRKSFMKFFLIISESFGWNSSNCLNSDSFCNSLKMCCWCENKYWCEGQLLIWSSFILLCYTVNGQTLDFGCRLITLALLLKYQQVTVATFFRCRCFHKKCGSKEQNQNWQFFSESLKLYNL